MENHLAQLFIVYGKHLMNDSSESIAITIRRYKSFFGVSPYVSAIVWRLIKDKLASDFNENHLLWALLFLKTYNVEHVNRSICKCDEKTYRSRVWRVIDELAFLNVVSSISFG